MENLTLAIISNRSDSETVSKCDHDYWALRFSVQSSWMVEVGGRDSLVDVSFSAKKVANSSHLVAGMAAVLEEDWSLTV